MRMKSIMAALCAAAARIAIADEEFETVRDIPYYEPGAYTNEYIETFC